MALITLGVLVKRRWRDPEPAAGSCVRFGPGGCTVFHSCSNSNRADPTRPGRSRSEPSPVAVLLEAVDAGGRTALQLLGGSWGHGRAGEAGELLRLLRRR